MSPSKIFLYFCLSFIGGIFVSSFFTISQQVLLPVLILGIILISIFWRLKNFVVVGFCVLFLVLGIWRHQAAELRIADNELRKYNDSEQEITLIGQVVGEPDIREKIMRLTIKTDMGKVLLTTWRYPEYKYGDKLRIMGTLESPPIFEEFNYRDFLKKDGIYSVMSWPEIELIGSGFGNPLMKALFSFKNKFQETAGTFLSPPQLGILKALFSGDESSISKEWKDKLNLTGTRHITAVSGMNITIIAFLIFSFALSFGLWRQQAFYLTVFFLLIYILMIGAPPSAVRAGIMAGILMTAQYLGIFSTASRAVFFAAVLMLFFNPLLLRLDVGFQLSFLAIFGLVYLQPFFFNWLKKIPDQKILPIRTTLSATLSAQIFTLPILIYNFGYIPLVSPITNILIVPFIAPITILIFIFGFSGMIFWFLGWILSWPTWLVLTYITSIIDWFSKLPFAPLNLENVHWIWLIISYLILGLIIWRLRESQKLKFLDY